MKGEPPIPARLSDDAPEWWEEGDGDELDEAMIVERLYAALGPDVRYELVDRRHAEWAMRRLAACQARAEESRTLAITWRLKIEEWLADELRRVEAPMEFFTSILRDFGMRSRAANPKEATIRLPSGVIKTTVPKTPKVNVVDEDALLAWLREYASSTRYEDIVQQKPKVLSTALRSAVDVQLELRPFCQVCGEKLRSDETVNVTSIDGRPVDGVSMSRVVHAGEGEYGHEPMPGGAYVARLDGKEVAGVVVELDDPNATVVTK